jgi:hypothetical protein
VTRVAGTRAEVALFKAHEGTTIQDPGQAALEFQLEALTHHDLLISREGEFYFGSKFQSTTPVDGQQRIEAFLVTAAASMVML